MAGPTRWGIIGAGKISHDFVAAIQMTSEFENQVAAVAARSLQKATEFNAAFDNSIPRVYGSYEELAQDHNIDVVYVGTINTAHFDNVMMLLGAGKAVVCEKPMGMNGKQVKALTARAKERKRFFMEGFWSRFFPIYAHLRGELAAKTIGDIHTITVNFGFKLFSNPADNERVTNPELGGGGIMDIGCYAIQLATMIFNEKPSKIESHGLLMDTGVDCVSHTTLWYSGNRTAHMHIAMDRQLDQTAVIMGSEGHITIPNFWNPEKMVTPTKTWDCPIPKSTKQMNYLRSEGFIYEINCVRECLVKGHTECSIMPHEHSIIISEVMEEVRKQLGVVYKQDSD